MAYPSDNTWLRNTCQTQMNTCTHTGVRETHHTTRDHRGPELPRSCAAATSEAALLATGSTHWRRTSASGHVAVEATCGHRTLCSNKGAPAVAQCARSGDAACGGAVRDGATCGDGTGGSGVRAAVGRATVGRAAVWPKVRPAAHQLQHTWRCAHAVLGTVRLVRRGVALSPWWCGSQRGGSRR